MTVEPKLVARLKANTNTIAQQNPQYQSFINLLNKSFFNDSKPLETEVTRLLKEADLDHMSEVSKLMLNWSEAVWENINQLDQENYLTKDQIIKIMNRAQQLNQLVTGLNNQWFDHHLRSYIWSLNQISTTLRSNTLS